MTKAALLQLTSSDMPMENLPVTLGMVRQAAEPGAEFVLTPEVTNCVSMDRQHQNAVLQPEAKDPTLAALRTEAAGRSLWLLVGSLALKASGPGERFVNRSFLINPLGQIEARYDKIHMFDVSITPEETYKESEAYRPGDQAVVAQTTFGNIGMSICYDLRFPTLYRHLAQTGADILTVPSAFSPVTGAAHWQSLLRARAIETGSFVLAPAQTGFHKSTNQRSRRTYGHSMAIDPWGKVISSAGTEPGILMADIDLAKVKEARKQVPSLQHDRPYQPAHLMEYQNV